MIQTAVVAEIVVAILDNEISRNLCCDLHYFPITVTATREGSKLLLHAEGAGKAFTVNLHGMGDVSSVDGGNLTADGTIEVAAFNGKVDLIITL